MKGKYILCAAGLSALLFGGCAGEENRMQYLGIEEAKRLALKEAELSPEEVEFTGTALNSREGKDYYQVDFTADGEDYQYAIDALTGVIIDSGVPEPEMDTVAAAEMEAVGSEEETGSSGSIAGSKSQTNKKMLTSEEAEAKALAHAGLTADQVSFVKCSPENDDGCQIYDVEFYSGDEKEYDYEIDAYTGEVLNFDYDAENYVPSASGTMISAEDAKGLALARVPGASAGDIYEFEADYDDGHTEYEGKIIYNGMEYEFEIDAYSGAFQSWEAEPADD